MKKFPKIKSLTVFILAAALAAGCGASAPTASTAPATAAPASEAVSASTAPDTSTPAAPDTTAPAASDQQIALSVMNFNTDNGDVDNQIQDKFTALHPNVTVTTTEKDFDQYFTLLATQIQSGLAPDAFATLGVSNSTMMDLADQGMLEPMESYFDPSQYADWLIRLFSYKGHVYSIVSMFEDDIGIFYNKKVFADNGLTPPKSQADMDHILDTLVQAGVTPFTIPGKSAFENGLFLDELVQAYAPDWVAAFPGNAQFTDQAFVDVAQKYLDWRDKGYFGKDYQANDVNSSIMELLQGKAAMFAGGSWFVTSMQSDDIGVFYFKQPDGKDAGIASPRESYGLSVYAQSPNKDMAIEFAKFFGSSEVQQIIGTVGSAVPSTCPAAKDVHTDSPLLQAFAGDNMQMSFYNSGGFAPRKGTDYLTGMTTLIQNLLFGNVTPTDFASQMNDLVDYNNYVK